MTQPAASRIPLSRLQLESPVSLGVFDNYEQAQRAVDYLSDREFPVQNVMIVGTDLRQVERVTGRLTTGRVLASGAGSGAWLGTFVGGLMWLFSTQGNVAMFLSAVITGALFGIIWAWGAYKLTAGQRDFTSVSQVVATRYEVLVESLHAHRARALMEDLRRGVPSSGQPAEPTADGQQSMPPGPWDGGQQPPIAPPPGWGPPAGTPVVPGQGTPPAPPAPTAPQYRTYGEALDAERAQQAAQGAPPPAQPPTPPPSQS